MYSVHKSAETHSYIMPYVVRDNAWSYDQLDQINAKEYMANPDRDTYADRYVGRSQRSINLMNMMADPKKIPQRAIMDMGAIFSAKTFLSKEKYNPKLDSPTGIIAGDEDEPTWWQVRFPGQNSIYEVSMLTLMKRADCCKKKVIT